MKNILISILLTFVCCSSSSMHKLVPVVVSISLNSLKISPNPVVDEFWVEGIDAGQLVQIFNYKRELVYEVVSKGGTGATGNVGGINPIPAGTYTVIVNDLAGILIKGDNQL